MAEAAPEPALGRLDPASDAALYRELSPAALSPALPPLFVLGTLRASIARMYFADVGTLSVGCYRLPGAGVTSHGAVVHGGGLVTCDQLNLSPGSIAEMRLYGALQDGARFSRVSAGEVVSLAGPGHLIYGHWLVDFLPKLYVLHALGYDLAALRYFLPANTPGFAVRWLTLLGIGEAQLIRYSPYDEAVGAEVLIVPTLLRTSSRAHPLFRAATEFLVDQVRARRTLPPPPPGRERIFISRGAAGRDGRMLLNRERIEAMAAAAGFAIVRPETLSLVEQISLFAGARQMIGEYGSGLHGSMFAGPGAAVCALRAGAVHPGFLQSGLCQSAGQHLGYVFGDADDADVQQEFSIAEDDFHWALRLLDMQASAQAAPVPVPDVPIPTVPPEPAAPAPRPASAPLSARLSAGPPPSAPPAKGLLARLLHRGG